MNKTSLVAILCLLSVFRTSAQFKDLMIFSPTNENIILSNDSIMQFYKNHDLSLNNNYIPKDTCFMKLAKIIQKLNEVYIFDSLHQKVVFYEGIRCSNNTLLLKNNSFAKLPTLNGSAVYDSMMSFITPISPLDHTSKKYTAIIIWNKCMGIKKEDFFVDWEKILVSNYGESIRIIKVNFDVNETYSAKTSSELMKLFDTMYQLYLSGISTKK